MDYLLSGSGGTDNLSLQDMIECDIKSEFGDLTNYDSSMVLGHLGVDLSTDLLNHNESMDILSPAGIHVSDIDTFSSADKISEPIDIRPDNSMSWLQTVNLSTVSPDVLNNDCSVTEVLMVNPQTGIPVQLQTTTASTTNNTTTTQANPPSRVQFVTATLPRGTTIQQALQGLQQHQQQQQQQQRTGNTTTNIQTISNAQLITQALTSGNCTTLSSVSMPSQTQVQQVTAPSIVTQQLLSSNNNQLKKTKNFDSITSKVFPKPVYSYSCLIAMALKNSDTGALPVSEIYSFMTENFPYFNTAPDGWKNSVRHNLSLNKCFEKIENPKATGNTRKGCLWGLNPAKVEKMDEEIAKWRKKDLEAIQRSMAKPEVLEILEKGNIGSHSPHHPNNIRTAQHQSYTSQSKSITPAIITNRHGLTSIATTTATTPVQAFAKPIMGDIQLSMIEIKPAEHSMLQTPVKIKVEPIIIKPEVMDMSGAVGVSLSSEDLNLLDTSLSLDPSLGDLALQNGLWEELGADGGISLDDIALTSLGQGFSNSSSPLTVQSTKTGFSSGSATSPLVSLLTSTGGSNAKGAAGSHTVTPSGGLAISRTIYAQM